MPTLHDTTVLTKKIFTWGGIGIAAIILLVFLIRGGAALFSILFPKAPPPPTTVYGKMSPVPFPESQFSEKYTYSIDTVSGKLPVFPDRAKVFETITPVPRLLDLRDSRILVNKTQYAAGETSITDTVYSWRYNSNFNKKITYNIVSKDFTIDSNYLTDPLLVDTIGTPTAETAIKSVTQFLETLELYPLEFDEEKTTTQYLYIQNAQTYPATSISSAQVTRVDLYHKDLNELPVMYPNPPFSSTYFIVKSPSEIVQAQLHFQTLEESQATYPIKSAEQAFEELKSGKGHIAAYYGEGTEIVLKDSYLAYFMSDVKQQFIQPIIVFEGKNGFYAYVTAISEEWVEQP
jgi:hypothetical protein